MSDLQSEPTMSSSDSIGPYLKKVRETKGLSLDQVASLTRIQSKFIEAIEDEEFQKLPERVFTRGFVRTYARSLGVNEEDALRRFSESSSDYYHQGQQAQQQAQLQVEEENRGKLNRNLVIIVTIVIIVALGFLLPKQQQSPPAPTTSVEETAPSVSQDPVNTLTSDAKPESTEPANPLPNVEDVTSTTEALKPDEAPTLPPLPPPSPEPSTPVTPVSTDPIRLEIEATQLTWVVVKSDNDAPKEALLQPGQQAHWEAQQQFTLTLGNAAGVTVRLNGEPRGPFGQPGEVVREVVLTP